MLKVTVVYALGFTITNPVLPFLTQEILRTDDPRDAPEMFRGFEYGLLTSAYFISKAICAPIIGHMSDVYQRKRVLALCFFSMGTCINISFASPWRAHIYVFTNDPVHSCRCCASSNHTSSHGSEPLHLSSSGGMFCLPWCPHGCIHCGCCTANPVITSTASFFFRCIHA